MKILFFSPYFYPYISGLTTYPFELLKHWAKNHQVTVLTFPHQSDLKTTEIVSGITIHRIPYTFKISKGYISLQSWSIYSHHLRGADIIITNLPNAEGVPLVRQAKNLDKKILALFHCQVDLGKSISQRLVNSVLNQAVQYQLNLADKIIGTTGDYLSHCRPLNHHQDKSQAIFPPIQTPKVDQPTLKKFQKDKNDHIWIGFAGRIAREKGIEYLIQATSKLSINESFELIFAGPTGKQVSGESKYYHQIIDQLEHYQVKHRFFGTLSHKQLGAFYQTVDMLILPSINSTEAFGLVQVEAILSGTPVIATNLPGIRVPIQKTGMGIIVEPQDSQSLTQAMKSILNQPSHFVNQPNINKAKTTFDFQKSLQAYDRILDQFRQ